MSSANYHSFFIRLIKHCPPISYLIQNHHPAHLHLAFGFSLIYPIPKRNSSTNPVRLRRRAIPTVPIRFSPPPVFLFFYKKFLCNPRQTPHTMTGTKKFQITNGKSKNKKRRRILCQENLQTKQLFQKQKVP